jgi:hypothetical protein
MLTMNRFVLRGVKSLVAILCNLYPLEISKVKTMLLFWGIGFLVCIVLYFIIALIDCLFLLLLLCVFVVLHCF